MRGWKDWRANKRRRLAYKQDLRSAIDEYCGYESDFPYDFCDRDIMQYF
jgi:hypothetical protein